MATTTSTPEAILEAVGGPENILHLTHCATRLRFELKDASVIDKEAVEKIPGVMGAVPQAGDRYQIIIGGAVQGVYTQIMELPEMKSAAPSDADVKAAARAKARGKNALVDSFFEYPSDSFRPLLPVLLGASMIVALEAVLYSVGVIESFTDDTLKGSSWVFVDAMFRGVFYFLPVMVAYNASKKLGIDPWVGTATMAAVMTPNFMSLGSKLYTETGEGSGMFTEAMKFANTTCVHNERLASDLCTAHVFGLPMQLNDYGGQVFVPLMMVAVMAPLYKAFKRLIPDNVQMVFVPFLTFLIMIPLTAFLIGPLGVWIGTGLGTGLFWLNDTAPFVFALVIPLVYPFLVPLGLHWPLNAVMLANIANDATGNIDFIQGPMGAWNFACFGATAAVLALSLRDKDKVMRQTASGALAAGLFGGISEPSLYGIHLRFKRIYPLMLVGCAVGGLIIGIGGGVDTRTFAFTSLLTIPVFEPMFLYAIAVTAAFATSFFLIFTFDYRTKEQKAEARAAAAAGDSDGAAPQEAAAPVSDGPGAEGAEDTADEVPAALVPGTVTTVTAPLTGSVLPLDQVADPVFSTGAVGQGAGVDPEGDIVVTAPAAGKVLVAPASGHAYGISLDNGVEILIHVGLDTVNLEGKGFDVKVVQGDRVEAGQELVRVDRAVVEEAGYPLTTPVLVTNAAKFASVKVVADGPIATGAPLIEVTA